MTRKCGASAATVGRNEPLVAPRPWIATTGGPRPGLEHREPRAGRVHRAKDQARAVRGPAGGGQEADADVEVAPDPQAARLVGAHAPAQVLRDPGPGLEVRRQGGVGLALGRR